MKIYPGYDTKLQGMVRLQFWRSEVSGVFIIANTPRLTLTQSGTKF